MPAATTTIEVGPTSPSQHFVSDERVDLEAGWLFDALSRYVPALAGANKGKYMKLATAKGGSVPVVYSDPGIGRLSAQVDGLDPEQKMLCQTYPGRCGNAFKLPDVILF